MPDLEIKNSSKALSLSGCSNSEHLIWQRFRRNSGIPIFKPLHARMRTLRMKYFGANWVGMKTKKPVKSTFYRLLNVFE